MDNPQDIEFDFEDRQLLGRLSHKYASDLEAVKELIKRGAYINAKSKLDGETVFYKATEWNTENFSAEVLEYLIVSAGADINVSYSPLWEAAILNRIDLVAVYLKHGANPNFIIDEGMSLLDEIEAENVYPEKQFDYEELIELLVKHGAKTYDEI